MTDKCREEFEKWGKNKGYDFSVGITNNWWKGKYYVGSTEIVWEGFQAAYNLREQENLQLKNFAEFLADIHNYCEVKTQDGKLAFMLNHERSCIDLAREALGLQREPLKLLVRLAWEDKDDELTSAIDAAHPLKTGDHKTRQEANQLVSNRHSKESLIGLVNYLLMQNKQSEQEVQRLREAFKKFVDATEEYRKFNCLEGSLHYNRELAFAKQALQQTTNKK